MTVSRRGGAAGTRVFRLRPWGMFLNALATTPLLACGVIPFVPDFPDEPLLVLVFVAAALFGVYLAVRVVIARVEYDDQQVKVVGLLWARTIARRRVIDIGRDLREPTIVWHGAGTIRVTRMSILRFENSLLLPREPVQRRLDFLERLELWAEGCGEEEIDAVIAERRRKRSDPPRSGTRRARAANRPRRSRGEVFQEFVVWLSWVNVALALPLLLGSAGFARRGPVDLEESAFLVVIFVGIAIVVQVLVGATITASWPARPPLVPPIVAGSAAIVAALVLWSRSEGTPEQVVSLAVALCAVTAGLSGAFLVTHLATSRRAVLRRTSRRVNVLVHSLSVPEGMWPLFGDLDYLQAMIAGALTWADDTAGVGHRRAAAELADRSAVDAREQGLDELTRRLSAVARELRAVDR